MKKIISLIAAFGITALCACTNNASGMNGEYVRSQSYDVKIGSFGSVYPSKPRENANPLVANIYCADPTSIEYGGRLYVYGTNDQQQYDIVGSDGSNTYDKIKSMVILSTDDMANWTYHGIIDFDKICPWATASWAPSIVSRTEEDGKTHFYLYYSNSGGGVGVVTAESPLGPWTDPLGKPLISHSTKGLKNCPIPFDPGVCIDDDGTGWLAFGGGQARSGSDYMPGSARIVKLGDDMISLASDIAQIPSAYFFEASELNFINGTYVYTYNTNWKERIEWENKEYSRPPICSMVYMTSQTPLDPESWTYRGDYFKNPGEQGLDYGNNHTHLQKYADRYYLFYHAHYPQKDLGTDGGFRSLCVNEALVNEETLQISASGTKTGAEQIKNLDPYAVNQAETLFTSSNISYAETEETGNMLIKGESGSWTYVTGADFSENVSRFAAKVKGKGRIEVYADTLEGEPIAAVEFDFDEFKNVYTEDVKPLDGVHNLYFVISGGDMQFDEWQFTAGKK